MPCKKTVMRQPTSYLRALRSSFAKHIECATNGINPVQVAAIHATILAVVIGFLSAFFLYHYGEVRAAQLEAMDKAGEINKVQFLRSAYLPKSKEENLVQGPKDIELVVQLAVALAVMSGENEGAEMVGDIKVPGDPADRAERMLEIMNIISHQYPFPKAIRPSLSGTSQFRPEPIVFTDVATLRQWLADLDRVTSSLRMITTLMPILFPRDTNSYLKSLEQRDKEIIEEAREPRRQIHGERSPYKLANNFLNGMARAEEVMHSVRASLKRADNLEANVMSKPLALTILVAGFFVFLFGVVFPLLSMKVSAVFYIHLPLLCYAILYIVITVKITYI